MDALGVVVRDVLSKNTSQVVLAEHDHMVEKLTANRAHEALRRAILPRALERRTAGTDADLPMEQATSAEKIASLSKIRNR